MEEDRLELVALVVAGLHWLAAAEISQRFALPPDRIRLIDDAILPGAAGVAKMCFSVALPSSKAQWRTLEDALLCLHSPTAFLALVMHSSDMPLESADEWIVQRTCSAQGWASAMRTWWGLCGDGIEAPTFRASCVRDGQHAFSSVQVAMAVAHAVGKVHTAHPSWFEPRDDALATAVDVDCCDCDELLPRHITDWYTLLGL